MVYLSTRLYLYLLMIFRVNVIMGKCTSPMDPIGSPGSIHERSPCDIAIDFSGWYFDRSGPDEITLVHNGFGSLHKSKAFHGPPGGSPLSFTETKTLVNDYLGFLWVAFWLWLFIKHPLVNYLSFSHCVGRPHAKTYMIPTFKKKTLHRCVLKL